MITFLIFFRQRKKKEDSDVIDKDASAAKNMLDFTNNLQVFTKDMIDKYQEAIIYNRDKILELTVMVEAHNDKIENIKRILGNEYGRRRYAESNICFVTDCKLRVPNLGTFKSEEDEVDLKELLK